MSQANKEIATRFIMALTRGDVETVSKLMTQDFVAVATGSSKVSGTRNYKDIVEFTPLFKRITKSGDGIKLDVLNLTAEEDRVALEAQGHATLISGAQYDNQYHFLLFIRDGKIYRMREHFDGVLVDKVLMPLVLSMQV